MRSLTGRILAVGWSAFLAFLILAFVQGVWASLLTANLKTTPAIPWAAALMALVLWLMWLYLGGKWWPRQTSATRRNYLRARRVPMRVFAWALLAGALSIVALTGNWIVMFQLVNMPANVLPDLSSDPALTVISLVAMASLVSPISEEAGFRGYCQVMLERNFRGSSAILISSVLFALAHFTHGFYFPKLLLYFLAGIVFGVMVYLSDSILPGIAVHILADLTFFTLVWPNDGGRRLVWEAGADSWFWIHTAQALIFTPLALLAFIRLAKAAKGVRAIPA